MERGQIGDGVRTNIDSVSFQALGSWRNLALRGDQAGASRIATQALFLKEHCSLTELEIDQLAHAALDAYLEYQSRLFPIDDLVQAVGVDVTHRLQAGGVVDQHDERASFSHHLHHDLLAARAFATVQGLWNHRGFDRLTFKASSFDALEAVAETGLATAQLDLLVRAVYDWNPYGAAYVLREGGASRVSPTVLIATTAMLAERRFDLVEASVHDAEDALVLLGNLVPSTFREVRSKAELIAAVSRLFGADVETDEWASLFTLPEVTEMPNPQLESLEQRDSLLGWTASNVARRLRLSDEQLERLRTLALSAEDLTVRWRAVHALGGHPVAENARVLFDIVRRSDEDFWVVRGALRALLEIAAVGEPVLRREILVDLGDILRALADSDPDDPIVNAFARYGELRNPPPGWDAELLPLAEDLWAAANTRQQQERWEGVAIALKNAQHVRGAPGIER
jgi:hypothetical protein